MTDPLPRPLGGEGGPGEGGKIVRLIEYSRAPRISLTLTLTPEENQRGLAT